MENGVKLSQSKYYNFFSALWENQLLNCQGLLPISKLKKGLCDTANIIDTLDYQL